MLFWKMMEEGGPVMWIIAVCSLIALFIFLKKTFQFHRDEINVAELMRGIFNTLQREGVVEAITLCDNTPGPVAKLVGAAILAYKQGDEDIRQAVDDAALDELPKLEHHLNLLGTIGFVLPLLGFLGTVLGMLQTFEVVRGSVYLAASDISGSVTMALVTTAAALAVAIPCYIGYNYLLGRVNSIALDMEKAALEITSFLERRRNQGQKDVH